MKNNIKVAVIGGTGKSGKYLVKQLLSKNYQINLLHRNPYSLKIDNPLINIVKGDARNADVIYNLLHGCVAILSCLSQPAGEETIFSDATRNIIKAMTAHKIKRYITTAGLNVDTPYDDKSKQTLFGTKWMYENYPKTTIDRQVEYEILTASDIDWTIIRLPLIEQTDDLKEMSISLKDCLGNSISATSLADFMIAQINNEEFVKQAPFIANK